MLDNEKNDVQDIVHQIQDILIENNVAARISFRLKDPYSILKKMIRKNIDVQELSDLIAIRIIVDTQEDCYKTLGVLNYNYQIDLERVKDFISLPKGNGYQSLHAVIVNALFGRNIEVQIRTNVMHEIAEVGAANHGIYKKEQSKKIRTLVKNISSDVSLQNAYLILDKFNWTMLDIAAYEAEIKNLWRHCLSNLSNIRKQFESEPLMEEEAID